eukprot:351028-Chlamydomonas_euryale.AAC.3
MRPAKEALKKGAQLGPRGSTGAARDVLFCSAQPRHGAALRVQASAGQATVGTQPAASACGACMRPSSTSATQIHARCAVRLQSNCSFPTLCLHCPQTSSQP